MLSESLVINLSPRYERNHLPALPASQPPFPVSYHVVHFKHASQYQIEQKIYEKNVLHIGLCFPVACNTNETATLVTQVLRENEEYEILGQNLTLITSKVTEASETATLNIFFILTMIGLTLLLSLITISTIYTHCFRKRFWKDFVLTQQNAIVEVNTEKGLKMVSSPSSETIPRKSFIDEFFTSFDITHNYNKLNSVKMNKKTLSVIHGLR